MRIIIVRDSICGFQGEIQSYLTIRDVPYVVVFITTQMRDSALMVCEPQIRTFRLDELKIIGTGNYK